MGRKREPKIHTVSLVLPAPVCGFLVPYWACDVSMQPSPTSSPLNSWLHAQVTDPWVYWCPDVESMCQTEIGSITCSLGTTSCIDRHIFVHTHSTTRTHKQNGPHLSNEVQRKLLGISRKTVYISVAAFVRVFRHKICMYILQCLEAMCIHKIYL